MTVKMNGNFITADPENIKWAANKSAPYGMQIIVLYGDPAKPGPYVFRAKMPSGYKLPPHKHPDERSVTVLKGTYWSGIGERYTNAPGMCGKMGQSVPSSGGCHAFLVIDKHPDVIVGGKA